MLDQDSDIPSSAGQMSPRPSTIVNTKCFDETKEALKLRRNLLSGFRKEINELAVSLDCTIISPAEIELNTQSFMEFKKKFGEHCNIENFKAADDEYRSMISNFLSDWIELKDKLIEVICKGEDAEKLCEFYRAQLLNTKKYIKLAFHNVDKPDALKDYRKLSRQVSSQLDPQSLKFETSPDDQNPPDQVDPRKLKIGYQSLIQLNSFIRKNVRQALTDNHMKLLNASQYNIACGYMKRTVESFKLLINSNKMRQDLIDIIDETTLKFKHLVEVFEQNYEIATENFNKAIRAREMPKPTKKPKKVKKLPNYPKLDLSNLVSPSVSALPESIKPTNKQKDSASRRSKAHSSPKSMSRKQINDSPIMENIPEDDEENEDTNQCITNGKDSVNESDADTEKNEDASDESNDQNTISSEEEKAAAILDNDDDSDDLFVQDQHKPSDFESSHVDDDEEE